MPSTLARTSEQGLAERIADALDALGLEELTENYRDCQREAEAALAEAFDPRPAYLAETPEVTEVNRVNTHDDGGNAVVPVVSVLFDPPSEPARDRVGRRRSRARGGASLVR